MKVGTVWFLRSICINSNFVSSRVHLRGGEVHEISNIFPEHAELGDEPADFVLEIKIIGEYSKFGRIVIHRLFYASS
jgi:hypothetical protein